MQISNFNYTHKTGTDILDWYFYAEVTVTTKRFLRKPVVEVKQIYSTYPCSWRWVDTGKIVPHVSNLVHAFEAKHGKALHQIKFSN